MSYTRPPTFALQGWYPSSPEVLQRALDGYLAEAQGDVLRARAVISPHAGYRYCGHVAGALYGRVEVPTAVVILGVDHWHRGAAFATQLTGEWEIPGAAVPIHEDLARAVHRELGIFQEDLIALEGEHSLEMQVPFLWRRNPRVRIVPLQLSLLGASEALSLGERLARVVARHEESTGERVLLVSSSDMHHAEQHPGAKDDEVVHQKDQRALEPILALDPEGLHRRVTSEGITMCGFVGATIALEAAKRLGAAEATLIRHATSAQVPPHNYSYVVGYAGVAVV